MKEKVLFEGRAPVGGGFRMEGYWIWCGSPIEGEDGRYHLFASRWPKSIVFHPGWLTNSEVVRAVADRPEGPYEFQEVVLPARGAEYWDGQMTHNPAVIRWRDQYVLFYTGTTYPYEQVGEEDSPLEIDDPRVVMARANKRIGVAVATSLEGPWKRLDRPVLSTRPGTFYSFLTSNPSPCLRPDGSLLLVFKGRAYIGHGHGEMKLGVALADEPTGPYRVVDDAPVVSRDAGGELEDPFVWREGEVYKLIAKDMTGKLCGEEGAGVYAESTDGIDWKWPSGIKAYSRKLHWDDGRVEQLGSFERPSLLLQDGVPTHLFAAVADGPGGFWNAENTWVLGISLVK